MPALPLINQSRPTPAPRASSSRPIGLLAVLLTVGLLAVPCGILLIINGLGMPLTALAGTPFASFLIPGLLLAIVVGGSLLGAAWLILVRHPWAWVASLTAGFILLGWILIEAVMITDGRPLQALILVASLLIIGLAWRGRPDRPQPKPGGTPVSGDQRPATRSSATAGSRNAGAVRPRAGH